jgi:hypothetical protein
MVKELETLELLSLNSEIISEWEQNGVDLFRINLS